MSYVGPRRLKAEIYLLCFLFTFHSGHKSPKLVYLVGLVFAKTFLQILCRLTSTLHPSN